MALFTDEKDIATIRESGRRLAAVRNEVARQVAAGVRVDELDRLAEKLIRDDGDEPAFLNYQPKGASRPFPATVCISVNEEIVHGIPTENPRTLREGDIVGIDLGLIHKGMITDSAVTVSVGVIDGRATELLAVTKEALARGIAAARGGNHVGDIGHAIESFVDGRFGIVRELGGHGVGRKVHEDPYVPNFGSPGTGAVLVPGMVLALEPMLNEGSERVVLSEDGYTFKTADGKRSAHFEHTILITDGDAEILTQ